MYEKTFKVEIVTPQKVMFQAEATSVSAPGVEGGFQVLFNHAPLLTVLEVGVIKVKDTGGHDTLFATGGGFVEVNRNHVVILVDSAERAGEIDVARARAARDRADQRLHAPQANVDVERARAALLRAMNRLRIAQRA
jgi:F-type H+-transporting ATPase subunit epsilon